MTLLGGLDQPLQSSSWIDDDASAIEIYHSNAVLGSCVPAPSRLSPPTLGLGIIRIDTDTFSIQVPQLAGRLLTAQFSGTKQPLSCLDAVSNIRRAVHEQLSQLETRLRMALPGRQAQPARRFGRVIGDASALQVGPGQFPLHLQVARLAASALELQLGLGIALGSCLPPPSLCLGIIAAHAAACGVHLAQIELRLGISGFGERTLVLKPPANDCLISNLKAEAAPEEVAELRACLDVTLRSGSQPPCRSLVMILIDRPALVAEAPVVELCLGTAFLGPFPNKLCLLNAGLADRTCHWRSLPLRRLHFIAPRSDFGR